MRPFSGTPRVLHVLAPAREGGLERVVSMLSELQGAHVAAVLSPGDAEAHPFVASLEAAHVPVTCVVVGPRSYVREYRALAALSTRLRPRVVHTHGYRADVIAGAVARAHDIPTVSTVHGFTGGGRRNRFNETVQVFALRHADAVLAVSRPLIERLARSGVPQQKIKWIPNGFAPSGPSMTHDAARQFLGIPADALVAGWVGRLSAEKGPDVMLEALAEADAGWAVSMIGDGRERGPLIEHAARLGIADRVVWHGAIPDAGRLMTAFDAFVLSSRTEGTPIALFEAMHAKVPVVATEVGGVPDVVAADHALIVPPESPRAIAEALADIRREPSAASKRSDLAYRRVIEGFSVEKWIDAVEEVYQTVCR